MTGVATSLREHGLRIGELEPGPRSSIADVGGVRVGHVTVVRDELEVVRTGVTAIVPAPVETLFAQPLRAGGSRGAPASASRAPARPPTTAAARSSSRSRRRAASMRCPTATSIRCSRRPSM
jgi:peptidase S58-like protein